MIACIALLTSMAILPGVADGRTPELKLEPCRIELVDGTTVKGHLAVQVEMDDRLSGPLSRQRYPISLRRVHFFDAETGKDPVFPSNHFSIPALAVAQIDKSRWQIELFFKWIKQNLRIKAFFGTSHNTVRTPIRIAASTYLLVAILKKTLRVDHSLARILQVIRVNALLSRQLNKLHIGPMIAH